MSTATKLQGAGNPNVSPLGGVWGSTGRMKPVNVAGIRAGWQVQVCRAGFLTSTYFSPYIIPPVPGWYQVTPVFMAGPLCLLESSCS
jgi:hypothetical protein